VGTGTAAKFAPARVEVEELPEGGYILRSPVALESYPTNLCRYLIDWAEAAPERAFLVERSTEAGWKQISYRDALASARSIAQSLLNRGASIERPLMTLSGNSIETGLLQLAAMFAGVPIVPVSPAYSLMSNDFGKLRYVFDLIRPAILYASDRELFSKALAALDLRDVELVTRDSVPGTARASEFAKLAATTCTSDVDDALSQIGPDTVAKILFTSGSTDLPKGVINTHGMLCSNQQAFAQVYPFITHRPPILVDWLPWNHTFGGNHNFNLVLRNGGTLYIDAGKPAPGMFEATVQNLREIAPTIYFNVPRGYQMLVPLLEQDADFRDHFFSNLDTVFYAAAALPQELWQRIEQLSIAALGEKIPLTSGYGMTESGPLATAVHFPIDHANNVGLPIPGTEIKMLPNNGKLELRLRGPNVTPGYFKQDKLTRDAFDEDQFLKTGDAGAFSDPGDLTKGLVFDGRVAEDFKLLTGSWVNTSAVRTAVVSACAEVIQDAVVTGHDRDDIGLLIIPNIAGIADLCDVDPETKLTDLVNHSLVSECLRRNLTRYNTANPASSRRIARVMILCEPLDIDAGEITDKGYINQRAVLECRCKMVEQLYDMRGRTIIIN
jgi:feruloyl-CoA synthase